MIGGYPIPNATLGGPSTRRCIQLSFKNGRHPECDLSIDPSRGNKINLNEENNYLNKSSVTENITTQTTPNYSEASLIKKPGECRT